MGFDRFLSLGGPRVVVSCKYPKGSGLLGGLVPLYGWTDIPHPEETQSAVATLTVTNQKCFLCFMLSSTEALRQQKQPFHTLR